MLEALLIIVPTLIFFLTVVSRVLEGDEGFDLDPDERILAAAYRHWVVIFLRCLLIGLAAALFIGIAFYRAIGGTFVDSDAAQRGLDFFNIVLLVVIGIVLFIRLRMGREAKEKKKRLPRWERWLFLVVIAILGFVFAFRYDGGRLFNIDPANAVGFDFVNALLIGIGILLLALVVYTYFDLRDDALVLTNYRVLRREVQELPILGAILSLGFRRRIVIREFLQQMVIEDVQQVNVRQQSYFEFYLYQFVRLLERFGVRGYERYGTIVVQSLSFQVIRFDYASAPNEMQKRILDRVGEINRNETPEALLQRTLEEQVWGHKAAPVRRFERPRHQQSAGIFSWLFPPNPEYRDDKLRTIIWRPSWVFILWEMLRAVVALIVIVIVAIVLDRYGVITGPVLVAVTVPLLVAALVWAWWIYDTYQHDLYILTSERIIDEDKAPFGPTTRREAELRSIQNVLFEENFFEGLLNFGQVIIRTGGAGGGDFTFTHVPNPREVQAQINAYIVDFRRREQEKNRRQTVQALTQYHALQERHEEILKPEVVNRILDQTLKSVATTIATEPDEAATRLVVEVAQREARTSARRELRNMVRRLIRRQSRGRA